jgi:hypothetical protein
MKNYLKTKNVVCKSVFCFWLVAGVGVGSINTHAARKYTHTPIIWYEEFEVMPSTTTFSRWGDYLAPHIKDKFLRHCPNGDNTLRYDSAYAYWDGGAIPTPPGTGNGNGMVREGITAAQCGLVVSSSSPPDGSPAMIGHYGKVILTNRGNTDQTLEVKAMPMVFPDSIVRPGMHSIYNANTPVPGSQNAYGTIGCTVGAMAIVSPFALWDSGTNISTGSGGAPSSSPEVHLILRPNQSAACLFHLNVNPGTNAANLWQFTLFGGVVYEVTVRENLGAILGMIEYGLEAPVDYLFLNPNHTGMVKRQESMGSPGRTF